jgi:hypothetical protein
MGKYNNKNNQSKYGYYFSLVIMKYMVTFTVYSDFLFSFSNINVMKLGYFYFLIFIFFLLLIF